MNYSIDITEEAEEHLKFFSKNDKRLVKKINNNIKTIIIISLYGHYEK